MTAYLAAGLLAVVTLPFGRFLAVVGRRPRRPIRPRLSDRPDVFDTALMVAAVASLPLLVGGNGGSNLVVVAGLVALATARAGPLLPATVLLIAATATTRVGATAVDDVAAAHVVLGPAVQSPLTGVAAAAAFAAAAGLAAAVALIPTRARRGGARRFSSEGAEAVALVALGLLTVIALMGPPFVGGSEDAGWVASRLGVVFGVGVVAAAIHRVVPSRVCARAPEAAAALGLTGFLVGGLST